MYADDFGTSHILAVDTMSVEVPVDGVLRTTPATSHTLYDPRQTMKTVHVLVPRSHHSHPVQLL